jgi:hypothetical protein
VGEREALSVAEAAGRGVRGGGCVWLVRDEARGHVIGGSPWARMRAGGGHRPREGMWRRLRAGASVVEEQHSELMVCGASFGAVVVVILTVLVTAAFESLGAMRRETHTQQLFLCTNKPFSIQHNRLPRQARCNECFIFRNTDDDVDALN